MTCRLWFRGPAFVAILIGMLLDVVPDRNSLRSSAQVSDSWPIQAVPMSPAILRLKQRLESGDPQTALASFWQEIARNGAPLIEPAPGDAHKVIVTFLWRGRSHTQSVRLLAPVIKEPRLPDVPLVQLPRSDVWYSSWKMSDDFRFSYLLAPNVPSGSRPMQSAVTDPLNPHTMEMSFEGNAIPSTTFSVASMPRAPGGRWTEPQPGIPLGKLQPFTVHSAVMHSERKLWVYTPPGYDAKATDPYRLLILCDGYSYQTWIPAPAILDKLLNANKIPPLVAVLVDNPPQSRASDLVYHPDFIEFLVRELLPWLHQRWNITRDPSKTTLGGYSASGSEAAYVALQHPELFGNVLSQDGAFWEGGKEVKWEYVCRQYEKVAKLPIKFFLEAGLLEDVSEEGPTLLQANRNLVVILRRKGYAVTYLEVGGTHEPAHWRYVFPEALISLAN